jgi:hypothetical protein
VVAGLFLQSGSVKTTIVYVSYRKDLVWLVHSLQLLFKFLKGDFNVVVRLEENCRDVVNQWALPVRYVFLSRVWPDGYTHAMYQKMIADDYVDWDTGVIWLLDSDHMLSRPTQVDELFYEGKPILHCTEWDEHKDLSRVARLKWTPPTERALGVPLSLNYMLVPPMAFYPDTFRSCRQRITALNGTSFIDFAYSDVPFRSENFMDHPMKLCDYETLGLYAAAFESHRYAIRPVPADWPFKVYWSHGEFPREIGILLAS